MTTVWLLGLPPAGRSASLSQPFPLWLLFLDWKGGMSAEARHEGGHLLWGPWENSSWSLQEGHVWI